jgi:ATP-dependent helicase Lhr and Lhr-like helicase
VDIDYLTALRAAPPCVRGGGWNVTSPKHADAAVIELLKSRIMSDRVILFCVNCKKWKSQREVGRVTEQPECPLCGSRMVAALKPWEEEEIKVVKKPEKAKNAEDRRRTKRVFRNANLVLSYGKTAAIALARQAWGRRRLPGWSEAAKRRARVLQGYFEG